jgi:GTP pyrophosphokinase
MEQKAISFEQLSDIIGFRVIVDNNAQCYTALGAIHGCWKMVPNFFKDYISTPKRNGYQSIHTTVFGPDDQRVELQIRTKEMHKIAETGVAAHWDYKERAYMIGEDAGKARDRNATLVASKKLRESLFDELQRLADLFDAEESSEIFLEHTKMEMYSDQVFAFTPKGDLFNLPQGASVLDFAYAVHTTIGDTCVGAKINGRHRPLRTRLQNGDSIEIICSNAQMPTPDTESFVITGRAKSAIRRRIRLAQREEFIELGRKMLEVAWRKRDLTFAEEVLGTSLVQLNATSTEDLFVKVGSGSMSIDDVVDVVFPGSIRPKTRWLDGRRPLSALWPIRSTARETKNAVPIKGLQPGLALRFATCCHPLPGDLIVGISAPGQGMIVHRLGCEILNGLDDEGLNLQWEPLAKDEGAAIGQIFIVATNEPGVLGETATTIAKHEGNITNVRIIGQDKRYAELEVDIAVRDVDHLETIISELGSMSVVISVERSLRRAAPD